MWFKSPPHGRCTELGLETTSSESKSATLFKGHMLPFPLSIALVHLPLWEQGKDTGVANEKAWEMDR